MAANEQFQMKDKGTNELKKIEDTKAPGTLFTAAPATTANEAFRRVNEDPLLRMRCVYVCRQAGGKECYLSRTKNSRQLSSWFFGCSG